MEGKQEDTKEGESIKERMEGITRFFSSLHSPPFIAACFFVKFLRQSVICKTAAASRERRTEGFHCCLSLGSSCHLSFPLSLGLSLLEFAEGIASLSLGSLDELLLFCRSQVLNILQNTETSTTRRQRKEWKKSTNAKRKEKRQTSNIFEPSDLLKMRSEQEQEEQEEEQEQLRYEFTMMHKRHS